MLPVPATEDLLPILTRDVIDAIANRPHEPETRRKARAETAQCLIEAFEPEDGVEIMLAGQTVMLQSVMVASIHDALWAATTDDAYRHRQQAVSMGRIQLSYLKEITRHRAGRPQPEEETQAVTVSAPAPSPSPLASPPAEAPSAIQPQPRPRTVPAEVVAEGGTVQLVSPGGEATKPGAPVQILSPPRSPTPDAAAPMKVVQAMTGT